MDLRRRQSGQEGLSPSAIAGSIPVSPSNSRPKRSPRRSDTLDRHVVEFINMDPTMVTSDEVDTLEGCFAAWVNRALGVANDH